MADKVYFAQKGFILHQGNLLLVRKSLGSRCHPGKWEVPGGRLEQKETLGEHLKREILEETGLQIEAVEPFFVWDWHLDGEEGPVRVVAVAVLCRTEQTNVTLSGQVAGDDLAEFAWVPVEQVAGFDLIPNMRPVIRRFLEKYC